MNARAALGSASESKNEGDAVNAAPKKERKPRGKKTEALAKTEGHDLENQQKATAFKTLQQLNETEQRLTAARGYQTGQNLAAIESGAQLAGYADKRTAAQIARLEDIVASLEHNAANYDPLAVLGDLGFLQDETEADELKKKLEDFLTFDFNKVSH
jgi:hypothetical protein